VTVDERRLADALRAAVPAPPPVPPGRLVAGARRRVVRRRLAWRAGLAASSVAVAGVAFVALQREPAMRVAGPPVPAGATKDPLTAPVVPVAQVTAAPEPESPTRGFDYSAAWVLTARGDDGRTFAVTVAVPACQSYRRFDVDETPAYVLVQAVLERPGVGESACLGNVPHVTSVTRVVTLAAPLGDRALLHAAVAH
jgi:hypothetical protein